MLEWSATANLYSNAFKQVILDTKTRIEMSASEQVDITKPDITISKLNEYMDFVSKLGVYFKDDSLMLIDSMKTIVNLARREKSIETPINSDIYIGNGDVPIMLTLESGENYEFIQRAIGMVDGYKFGYLELKTNYKIIENVVICPSVDEEIMSPVIMTPDGETASNVYGVFTPDRTNYYILTTAVGEGDTIPDLSLAEWTVTLQNRQNIINWLARNNKIQVIIDKFEDEAIAIRKTIVDKNNNIDYTYPSNITQMVG